MIVLTTTKPALEPMTVEEARAELRLDPADDDQLTKRLPRARRAIEQWSGHRLITQTVTVHGVTVANGVAMLPIVPVQSVEEVIAAFDADGDQYDAETPAEILEDLDVTADGTVRGFSCSIATVSLSLVVGYGDAADDVPEDFTAAILQLLGQWSEWREAVAGGLPGQGAAPPAALPYSVQELIASRRVVRAG